jgi:ribosomal protein L16/L10AE
VTSNERKNTESKILEGARVAIMRLVADEGRNSGELTVYRDGKVITIKAKDVRLK